MKDYEVVISGVSGSFPECLNFKELEEKIYTKENLVTEKNSKWKTREIPWQLGKMKDSILFDDTFFGIHRRLTIVLDPHAKHSFEKTYAAIIDAGRNPQDFFGSNTAMLMSSCINETEGENMLETKHIGHLLLGYSRCMQSNRVSYAFNFKGPSVTLVAGWEGAVQALAMAHSLIRRGHVKQALVGGTNLTFYPQISRNFQDMARLNDDGKTKSFSADADGYSRSDGIVMFFLQRAEDALRSYGSVVKVLSRAQMDSRAGLLEPQGFSQFLGEFYADIPVKPSDIAYIEGDGCASLKTDAMELNALSEVLCSRRDKPLPVTCSKTRLGHAESAAPFISLASAIISMKTGHIPPVLHYTKPNPLVPALKDGSIKIVTEKTPLEGDYVGVNTIGLCSTFGHILIKRNPKTRPPKIKEFPKDGIPRLFFLSGRDEAGMKKIFEKIQQDDIDDGYYSLNHLLFRKEFPKHLYRGYSIKGENQQNHYQITPYPGGNKRPVWFIFSGMGSQWPEMGKGIMNIPIMRESFERSHKTLLTKGVDLMSIITRTTPKIFDNILNCFVGIAAIQIALVDLLEELGIKPDGIVGHSVGELGCGYADKCLTAEQMILAAYARGRASNEANLIKGMMAAVGRGYKDIRNEIPEGIEVACHNSENSCTLSGPAKLMEDYVSQLKSQGVFAKLVNVANIAYHSKNIAPAAPLLLKYLKEIIPVAKMRSGKWISSSVAQSQWDSDLARYCSAEYHTNNLLSHVLFEEATAFVPENAICIEIAPHGLLQAIVKRSLATCTHIPLTNRTREGSFFTIEALALLFNCGVEMDLTKLYPRVEYPLPRETEFMHSIVTWNHSELWVPISIERDLENIKKNVSNKEVDLFKHPDEGYLLHSNHHIAGRAVFPSANLLCILMETLTEKLSEQLPFRCYEFQSLKFFDAIALDKITSDKLNILYQSGSGRFEVLLNEKVLLMGLLLPAASLPQTLLSHHLVPTDSFQQVTRIPADNVYQFFQENDCNFSQEFRNITDIRISDQAFIGRVKWQGSAEFYIDAILKLIIFHASVMKDCFLEIDSIGKVMYDSTALSAEDKDVFVFYDDKLGQIAADGVRISGVRTRAVVSPRREVRPQVEKLVFVPYSNNKSQDDFLDECFRIVVESAENEKISVVGNEKSPLFYNFVKSKCYNDAVNSKVNIKLMGYKDLSLMSDEQLVSSAETFLVISDDKLPHSLVNQMDKSKNNCYLIQSAVSEKRLTPFKHLSPILELNLNSFKLVFLKKSIEPMMEANFIQVPDGCSLEKPENPDELTATNKSIFLLFRYKTLSDIPKILKENSAYTCLKNTRFMFTGEKSPRFDPTSDFYLEQIKKDLKINIHYDDAWGSLRDDTTALSIEPSRELLEFQMPLNNIKCDTVDIKVLGLNMQNFVIPTNNHQLGVLEYAGVGKQDKDVVIGLGKLSPDNNVFVDPILVWRKPEAWTVQQAASVPLYYSVAYYLLRVKYKPHAIPNEGIFIHGAHTAFSQAVINVALGMKWTIYTTCFSQAQKNLILKRFPQIDESKIYVLDEVSKFTMVDSVIESTGGGVSLVVDCLNDLDLINATMQCIGQKGKYCLICYNDMPIDITFGMSIFMKESAVMGFNPDLIFEMDKEEKRLVVNLVEEGMKSGAVVPLDSAVIDGTSTRKLAIQSLVSESKRQGDVRKILINLEKAAVKHSEVSSPVLSDKNYLIIGSYKSLWFDMMKLLVSWGRANIYLLLDRSTIPEHIQIRLNNLLKRHTSVYVGYLPVETLSSSERCDENFQRFTRVKSLDKVFYIMPELECELEMVDSALRKYCPECWLVCIGKGCRNGVTQRRNEQGFHAVSFLLKRESIRNRSVVNALDHWFRQTLHVNDHLILLDEETQVESGAETNNPEILPQTMDELVELVRDPVDKPLFIQVSTLCPTNQFAKEIDPLFFFPGFKVSKTTNLISRLCYPSYLAKYPASMKSIDEVAIQFSKELVQNFDLYMFTLVAEGWAGPLVLRVAHELEVEGKTSEVILLDAAPSAVRRWSKNLAKTGGIISNCVPSFGEEEEITVDHLKRLGDRFNLNISKEDEERFSGEEMRLGLDALINRLEMVSLLQNSTLNIGSKVHLFTARDDPLENHKDVIEINEITRAPCDHHVIQGATSRTLLESSQLVRDISNLALVEFKSAAKKQNVVRLSTLHVTDLR